MYVVVGGFDVRQLATTTFHSIQAFFRAQNAIRMQQSSHKQIIEEARKLCVTMDLFEFHNLLQSWLTFKICNHSSLFFLLALLAIVTKFLITE